MAYKKPQKLQEIHNRRKVIESEKPVFSKDEGIEAAREASKQAEQKRQEQGQKQEEQERLKRDQKQKQGDADSAVQTNEGTNNLSPDQQNKAKDVADLIFQVKNLQDIHTKAGEIKSDLCTKEGLQNIHNILFKTSGLNVFGDANSDSGKKSPLLSSEYAGIKLCDFDSEDDKTVKTKCFPGELQSGTIGISKFMNEPDCARAYTFFNDSHDDPTLLGGIKIMAQAFYAKAGELSENDIPQQINKFCSIQDINNTPAGPELCNSFNMDSLSDFISQ